MWPRLLAISILCLPGTADAERTPLKTSFKKLGFEEIKRDKGVIVYKDPKSSIIRIGAEGRFPAPPEMVQKVLLDYEHAPGRIGRVSESDILEKHKNWLRVYQRLNLPIISDRDFNLKVKWGVEGKMRYIEYKAEKRGRKPRSGIVRVTHHEGSWQLAPIPGTKWTQVRFQVTIDLAGMLPKWLARSNAGKEIPDLFMQVQKMLPKKFYY